MIAVSDWERSNTFYRDVLGRSLVELGGGRWAHRFGDQQLERARPRHLAEPVAARSRRAGWAATSASSGKARPIDAVEHLRAHGVEPELGAVERAGARGTGTSVYFRDPDGSLLELLSYER